MTDKPKIYGFCSAGCKWEAVHKEDFLNACAFVKINAAQDGKWYLTTGKQYKIIGENVENTGYAFTIKYKYNVSGTATEYSFTIPHDDKYADYVVFKLLEASIVSNDLVLVYELAGIRYTETITGSNITLIDSNNLYVASADNVYYYNDDASFVFGDEGDDGLSTYPSNLSNTTSSTVSIAKDTITIPNERTIQIGDFILCADNNVFKVNATGTTNLTVEYFTNLTGAGVPSGGSAGQILKKTANSTEWANEYNGSDKADIDASNLSSANVTSWNNKLHTEQVEVVYDKDSSDSSINWGYTSGIQSGEIVLGHNFSNYKRLRVYASLGLISEGIIFDMDLLYLRTGGAMIYDETDESNFISVSVDSSKTRIMVYIGTHAEEIISSDYIVYKIEGVS